MQRPGRWFYAFVYGKCFFARTIPGVHGQIALYERTKLDHCARLQSYRIEEHFVGEAAVV